MIWRLSKSGLDAISVKIYFSAHFRDISNFLSSENEINSLLGQSVHYIEICVRCNTKKEAFIQYNEKNVQIS